MFCYLQMTFCILSQHYELTPIFRRWDVTSLAVWLHKFLRRDFWIWYCWWCLQLVEVGGRGVTVTRPVNRESKNKLLIWPSTVPEFAICQRQWYKIVKWGCGLWWLSVYSGLPCGSCSGTVGPQKSIKSFSPAQCSCRMERRRVFFHSR